MLVELAWVGYVDLGHEALRRGNDTPPFHRLTLSADAAREVPQECGNVLHGLITDTSIQKYTEDSGAPLDKQQRVVCWFKANSRSIAQQPETCTPINKLLEH